MSLLSFFLAPGKAKLTGSEGTPRKLGVPVLMSDTGCPGNG